MIARCHDVVKSSHAKYKPKSELDSVVYSTKLILDCISFQARLLAMKIKLGKLKSFNPN